MHRPHGISRYHGNTQERYSPVSRSGRQRPRHRKRYSQHRRRRIFRDGNAGYTATSRLACSALSVCQLIQRNPDSQEGYSTVEFPSGLMPDLVNARPDTNVTRVYKNLIEHPPESLFYYRLEGDLALLDTAYDRQGGSGLVP